VRARTFVTINSSGEVVPAPSSPVLGQPYNAHRGQPSAPGSRSFQPRGTWDPRSCTTRSNPARAVVPLPKPTHQGKSSPVDHFAIEPGLSVWPPALPHTAHAPRNAPAPVLPLPRSSSRALCAARLNTRSLQSTKPPIPNHNTVRRLALLLLFEQVFV
jgi:hypothetical protein